ncbi:MAG: histidine ammonia-lyase [Flavobacteriales bacterium]|nr:histidine ammonia-lyase [Flavobacteriales bacterium]
MKKEIEINHNWIKISDLTEMVENNAALTLSEIAKEKTERCYRFLQKKLNENISVYGVNTGFGALCNTRIPASDLAILQKNLVMSHACGTGEEVPKEIVKLMLFLKIKGLAQGHSGVQLATVQRLIDFYNNDITPLVYQQGSLGASGDLAPLAHLSLPLIGIGEVYYQNKKISGSELNKRMGWNPVELQAKEGLALLNGTQFMSAYGTYLLMQLNKLSAFSDVISCISIEAFDARPEPFDDLIHKVRPHNGQFITSRNIQKILNGSALFNRQKEHVQDPYSFRCIPQVHGASKDAIMYIKKVFETEINSVTDNPTLFANEEKIISGGNFHGQPLALALDFLCLAMAELGSISERRVYKLISGQRGLPPFLATNPGLNSGMMILQYTAASIVSQNKQLCTPASIDSIDSSNGQEDHVSMGANAATKAFRILENFKKLLAIEILVSTQALGYRKPLKSSAYIEDFVLKVREKIPFLTQDIEMHILIKEALQLLNTLEIKADENGVLLH